MRYDTPRKGSALQSPLLTDQSPPFEAHLCVLHHALFKPPGTHLSVDTHHISISSTSEPCSSTVAQLHQTRTNTAARHPRATRHPSGTKAWSTTLHCTAQHSDVCRACHQRQSGCNCRLQQHKACTVECHSPVLPLRTCKPCQME